MVELLIISALGVGHSPVFDCTEVFKLVVPKSVYACENDSLGALWTPRSKSHKV